MAALCGITARLQQLSAPYFFAMEGHSVSRVLASESMANFDAAPAVPQQHTSALMDEDEADEPWPALPICPVANRETCRYVYVSIYVIHNVYVIVYHELRHICCSLAKCNLKHFLPPGFATWNCPVRPCSAILHVATRPFIFGALGVGIGVRKT